MGAEHAAHEFHELGGPGRGVQGVGQGVYFVLDRADKEFSEALVGKAGVFEGVPDLSRSATTRPNPRASPPGLRAEEPLRSPSRYARGAGSPFGAETFPSLGPEIPAAVAFPGFRSRRRLLFGAQDSTSRPRDSHSRWLSWVNGASHSRADALPAALRGPRCGVLRGPLSAF